MEKKTDWTSIYVDLGNALERFEGENSAVDAVHDMIVALMDLVYSYM